VAILPPAYYVVTNMYFGFVLVDIDLVLTVIVPPHPVLAGRDTQRKRQCSFRAESIEAWSIIKN
jgi:hypothetical protein